MGKVLNAFGEYVDEEIYNTGEEVFPSSVGEDSANELEDKNGNDSGESNNETDDKDDNKDSDTKDDTTTDSDETKDERKEDNTSEKDTSETDDSDKEESNESEDSDETDDSELKDISNDIEEIDKLISKSIGENDDVKQDETLKEANKLIKRLSKDLEKMTVENAQLRYGGGEQLDDEVIIIKHNFQKAKSGDQSALNKIKDVLYKSLNLKLDSKINAALADDLISSIDTASPSGSVNDENEVIIY